MKLIHLSDPHFGTESPTHTALLIDNINAIAPDLIIISGDFTQSATEKEFKKAQAFVKALSAPAFCIPGNHDIPGFNLYERFFHPYRRYKKFINNDICPTYSSDLCSILGLNSNRRALPHWNWANGAISKAQRDIATQFFSNHQDTPWRICTLHHPIHKIEDSPIGVAVYGHKEAMQCFTHNKVDLILTGHLHQFSVTQEEYDGHKTFFISATTALSSRLRGGVNGFNVITLEDSEHFSLDVYGLTETSFEKKQSSQFSKTIGR